MCLPGFYFTHLLSLISGPLGKMRKMAKWVGTGENASEGLQQCVRLQSCQFSIYYSPLLFNKKYLTNQLNLDFATN